MGKQVDSRRLAYRIQTTYPVREDAWDFLRLNIAPDTQIATDGAKIYRGMEKWLPVQHRYDIHRKFEFTQISEPVLLITLRLGQYLEYTRFVPNYN